eukprot:7177318-Pyramimonas_sp.AAC.1
MRNLGHELSGRERRRPLTRQRISKLGRRMKRAYPLQKAAGTRVSVLWRTGLLPGASHCSAVSGTTDAELRKLRAAAGAL